MCVCVCVHACVCLHMYVHAHTCLISQGNDTNSKYLILWYSINIVSSIVGYVGSMVIKVLGYMMKGSWFESII